MTRVLVAYATKDIAEAIGEELRERGLRVEVRDVRAADPPDHYDAVVLGSAVYAARWRREATRYLKRHAGTLVKHRVWLFESGWIGKRPERLVASPAGRRRATQLGAEPPKVFGGRLDPNLATGFFDRMLAKRMPGDFRNFDEIRTWPDNWPTP